MQKRFSPVPYIRKLWDLSTGCGSFATSNSFAFSDSKTPHEIPAPLSGLVFVRSAPENFDAANAVLRMTGWGGVLYEHG